MKSQILILGMMIVSINAVFTVTTDACASSCSSVLTSSDCTGSGCIWSSTSSSCSAPTCTSYSSQSTCDATSGCAWTNAGACATFTQCSDYTVSTAGLCYLKSSTCVPGTTASGSTPCVTGTLTCSTITDSTTCLQGIFQSDGQVCYWSGSACVAQNISSCSTITNQTLCTSMGCAYANSACSQATCSSLAGTSAACTSVYVSKTSVNVCLLTGSTCGDATDSTSLTSSTCNSGTGGSYYWNASTSACVQCTSSSSSKVLYVIGLVLLLIA